eukprot:COSAG01_NODE_12701_length_1697_cov_13.915519_1_plen_79_part_00
MACCNRVDNMRMLEHEYFHAVSIFGRYFPMFSGGGAQRSEASEPESALLRGRHGVFLSVESGGRVVIDWFRSERSQAI